MRKELHGTRMLYWHPEHRGEKCILNSRRNGESAKAADRQCVGEMSLGVRNSWTGWRDRVWADTKLSSGLQSYASNI